MAKGLASLRQYMSCCIQLFTFTTYMEKKKDLLTSNRPENVSFEWSLKPITVLMNIFGQEMVMSKTQNYSKPRSFLILLVGLTILIINIMINTVSFIKVFLDYRFINAFVHMSFQIIGHLVDDFMIIGIPLSFMAIRMLTCRWKNLLSSLKIIQSEMNLSKQVHEKIKFCALFFILFLVCVSI